MENMDSFPKNSLKPKNETNSLNFLKKFPEFDGRDCTIAVLDSGVSSLCADLRKLPNGDVKVIERFDCSGAGDVDVSKEVTATDQGCITGLSGRTLKLSEFMLKTSKSDVYRVGLKSLHDLFPNRIRDRDMADLKLKNWDESNKKCLSQISREINEFETKNPNAQNLSFKDKLAKENLDGSFEFLTNCDKKFSDVRISYDIVAFQSKDGDWLVCIDTTETGDLENAIFIKEYSKYHDVAVLPNLDHLAVSFNFHDVNTVELVGMCSSHGTHVASIAAGFDQENEELNGVAPGAKIVSLTIGDGRLGSMETGTSLVRAVIKIMELCEAGTKIDIVNMSYGEHSHWSNSGRVGDMIMEVVNKYNIIWVASAGNHGPALCTIGTPPDLAQSVCVGVGAYISPEMMEAEYVLRQKLPGNVYTWTSRDPTIDGGSGITVCAPGGAIASVPEFTFCKSMLMNGTSMSAPHVSGSLALVLSGLKQLKIDYTSYSIKRALSNTATKLSHVCQYGQGAGLLNVEKLFEYLETYKNCPENRIRFAVTVGSNGAKGIHLRNGVLKRPEEYAVSVEPVLFNEKFAEAKEKIAFNMRLTLVASANWVFCGSFLDLSYNARSFNVRVDPTGLQAGVHSAKIKAYDSSCVQKGALFEVPITVVQPIVVDNPKFEFVGEEVLCKPNTIIRTFLLVPSNATYATLELISSDPNDKVGGKFLIHTMQVLKDKYCKQLETQKILPVNSENCTYHPFKVMEDNILEICIAKYWSNFGDTPLKYRVKFHGFQSSNSNVMHSANGIHRLDVVSLLTEEIQPQITLKTSVMILKSTEQKITPLTKRDLIPPARQIFQNQFTFALHLSKGYEVAFHVPYFYSTLYESEFESQFWMVFDSNKFHVCSGDAYSNTNFVKLEKGDYTIKLQIRHEKKDVLEKISEAVMLATFKLSSSISVDVYKSHNTAITGSKKVTNLQVVAGKCQPLYIAPLSEKVLKNVVPSCSWLEGQIVLPKDDYGKKVDVGSFQYLLVEGPPKKPNGGNNVKDVKSKMDEYKEAIRDLQCNWIQKMEVQEAENLYKEVVAANQNFLTPHLSLITSYETTGSDLKCQLPFAFKNNLKSGDQDELKSKLSRILELTDLVIQGINIENLLAFYGLKSDNRPDASKIKVNMDKQKQQLLEAYTKKVIVLGKLSILGQDEGAVEEVEKAVAEVTKFVDLNDLKILPLSVWSAWFQKHFGRMLKYLQKLYEEKNQREFLDEMRMIVVENEWNHVEKLYLDRLLVFPANYRPF